MSNVEIGIKINAKINENINKQIDDLERKFSDLQTTANKEGFGGKIKDEIQSAKTEVSQLKEEFKSAFEAFKSQKIDTSEFNKFVKSTELSLSEMKKQIINVEETVSKLSSAFKMGQNSSSFEKRLDALQQQIDGFVKKTQDGITVLSEFNKMVNSDTTMKVKGDTSELGKDLDQKVSSFTFKKGGIRVPISLDASQLPKLQKKYDEIIGMLQSYADSNPVDVTMRLFPLNTTKAGAKEVTEAVRNVQAQIANLPEGELKSSMASLYNDLEKQYQKAVRLKIDVDLGETQASIKQRIKELNDAIKEQGFTIYPNFEIDDVNADKISAKLSELQEKITIKTTSEIKSMSDSLTKTLNTNNVKEWATEFNAALDSIQTKLDTIVPLMEKLNTVTITNTKGKKTKGSVPDKEDVNLLVEFTNAIKTLRESLKTQQNSQVNIDISPLMEKLDILKATIAMVHAGLGNLQAKLSNVKGDGGLQIIYSTLQNIETILSEINTNKEIIKLKVEPKINIEEFVNKIQSQIQSSSGVKIPISVLESSIDSFINEIQFSIDSRLTNGDIGTESFLPSQDNSIGSDQITSLNRRVGSLKEKIDLTWKSWYEFAQAAVSGTNLAKEGVIGVINKLEELSWALQGVSNNFSGIDFSKQLGDIDTLRNIVELNNGVSSSASNISAEAKSMEDVYEKALRAAQAKEKFAGANKEVLESIINSLSALNSEGKGFENLNRLINNLARNKDDRITDMVANLELLRDALSKPVEDNSFIKAIQEIASQGDALSNVAVVLNANADRLRNAISTVNIVNNSDSEQNLQRRIDLYNQIYKLQTQISKYQLKGVPVDDNLIFEKVFEIEELRDELKLLEQIELSEEQLARLDKETSAAAQEAREAEVSVTKKAEKELEKYESKVISLKKQLVSMMNNGKLMNYAGDEIRTLYSELDSTVPFERLRDIENEIKSIQIRASETGNTGKTLLQQLSTRFQSLATYLGSFASFYRIIGVIRQAYTNVADLNAQMIELAKVSEQTFTQIKGDFSSYADVAKNLGATISDTISATADWARLGYNVPDAKELARVALLYKNVGDGIDITKANESLISTLQGYQMTADESEHIVDVFNEVANNYAIDTAGIGEALQRSAASLNAANTSLEESVALVTAANTVLQNPESVGTTFKTLSARIRGATTELQDLGEEEDQFTQTTSKLQNLVKSLTGFDILKEDQKTYKSIYDILIGIGDAWKDLDDIERASLGEALAGKRNANALYAVLDNIDTLKSAYETAENSAGSAMREQENFEQGLEYSTNKMKAALEELSADFLHMDFLKNLVDGGTTVIELVDKLISKVGLLKTAIIGIATVVGSQKLG